jgi:hypothetical protein
MLIKMRTLRELTRMRMIKLLRRLARMVMGFRQGRKTLFINASSNRIPFRLNKKSQTVKVFPLTDKKDYA